MNNTTSPVSRHELNQAVLDRDQVDLSSLMSELGDRAVPPPKLYRMGEVIQYSGFSRQTIHNYTAMGLIRESQWTQKGHRLYDAQVFRYLAVIKHLKERYSLSRIKQMLEQITG